ncbi:response regulator [Parvularcula oceani]|uniref:response regulator n=1 Tax=Parvularcula oceani TaxID=1247963 RepID=UPI0004E11A0C|nr:response regulator [Parvularcula oceani]
MRRRGDDRPALLVVDDEPSIAEPLSDYLEGRGFAVSCAGDAAEARAMLAAETFDLAVIDIMMPGEDGLSLTRWVRATSELPVILLTARGEPMDRIIGLEMGADDYLPKPFEPRELLARIRTVLRRAEGGRSEGGSYAFAGFVLHAEERRLLDADGAEVPLTGGEFALLVALLDAAPRVVDRDRLLTATQGREAHAFDRSVDNQISRLRRKIEPDPRTPSIIKTHRGGGYALAAKAVRR